MTYRKLLVLGSISFCLSLPVPGAAEDFCRPDQLTLVDDISCGEKAGSHLFREGPKGCSRVQTVLGRSCRVLPIAGEAKYFAYRIGQNKGLKPGAAYLLVLEYPEDTARTIFVGNRGAETILGFTTGAAVGDVLHGRYVSSNPESLRIPLSGQWQKWQMYFHLHQRTADRKQPRGGGARPLTSKDGFWVVISQSKQTNHPMAAGAAVRRIALYEVKNTAANYWPRRLPPKELPRRHLFYREEMSDGVIGSQNPTERGVAKDQDWYEYKAKLMRLLGINTFCKDLLEFGHNQGWDATPGGGNDWYWASKSPKRWEQILEVAQKYELAVLPYYEYCGGVGAQGLGKQKRCVMLGGGRTYTHVSWCENANLDITDPESLADAKKLLDATILRYKDKVDFVGAWFRPRPSQMPISFANQSLQLFAVEANDKRAVTREDLQNEEHLREKYYQWWFQRRRQFLLSLRDHLRQNGCPQAILLFTTDAGEAGCSLKENGVVTDNVATWTKIQRLQGQEKLNVVDYESVVRKNLYLQALRSPRSTWAQWEWQHSCPKADPEHYSDEEGVLLTYSFNRAYTVSVPEAFEAFRTRTGLAAIRHYFLNENEMNEELGYFVADVERAGPYCMLAEARAMAYGDPRYLGYLASNCFNRGFPQYVRAFNAAFLALPAVPGTVLKDACRDADVVIRQYQTKKYGTYLAVVNVGWEAKQNIKILLPVSGTASDAATGENLSVTGQSLSVSLYPCQLQAIHIQP